MRIRFLFPCLHAALALAACSEDTPRDAAGNGHWELSPEYVSWTMLMDNPALGDAVKYGQYLPLKNRDLPPGLYARYRRMAANMKLNPAPALYLDAEDKRGLPQASAHFTRTGKSYLLVNRSALSVWTARELTAVLGHELVHIAQKHVTAENLAKAYNHPELSFAHELEADRIGSGPLGSCDPQALEDALHIVVTLDMQDYLGQNPQKTNEDYNALTGEDHPRWPERSAALEAMAASPEPECKGN